MPNINRDYLVVIDVKSGNITAPSMYFYNTDKNTSNIYVQLVKKETTVDATPIENATNYIVEAKIVKPGPVSKDLTGVLVNDAEAIYEFDLPNDCTNLSGSYKIEFWVKAKVNDRDEMITSSKAKYTVKPSILTDLDEAIEDHDDYPLFLKLMEEVKVINETAHELDTTIRTLQADMIEANNEMKTNEATRQANEAIRVTNENARKEAERTRANQEVAREQAEATREANEQQRIANENERKTAENNRVANESVRATNENERIANENARVSAENTRVANEEERQTNEANRETAEQIRRTNEEARITAENARVAEHEQMRTELNEVKAENAVLMENDKKIADRMTQVEISDKRQYVIMEGLMNSAGDGYLKIEDTGNDTTLYNSVEGFVDVKNITGNTMVNSIKNPDDELTLNGDINTSGQSVTLTTAVDGGQVDVLAEGNTMVNVCDQQEAVAITKSYTVESGNHVALQGEYDGKARPVVQGNTLVNLSSPATAGLGSSNRIYLIKMTYDFDRTKVYTFIFNLSRDLAVDLTICMGSWSGEGTTILKTPTKGTYKILLTPYYSDTDENSFSDGIGVWTELIETEDYSLDNIMILEGDYTNKPIPNYFTGMQSSFEDKVVTQEMVDSGKELAENLGKYKVEYKVTGKNKIPYVEFGDIQTNGNLTPAVDISRTGYIPIKANTNYKWSENNITDSDWYKVFYYDKNKKFIKMNYNREPLLDKDGYIIVVRRNPNAEEWTPQLEEGSTATPYEPYKEFTKTYYLNSPLLEGDTIEESGGNVYHVHRYGKVVLDKNITIDNVHLNPEQHTSTTMCATISRIITNAPQKLTFVLSDLFDGSWNSWQITNKEGICIHPEQQIVLRINRSRLTSEDSSGIVQYFQQNPTTIVYPIASPQYELISQSDSILTDSYVAGHLDFDTAVPVERVKFLEWGCSLKYLYPSTQYTVQFESDNVGKVTELFCSVHSQDVPKQIVKGINKFTITTGETITRWLGIVGEGFSASNIVVTEATDKDFGYFAGMKSVGELEENTIEIVSANGTDSTAEGYLSNSKQILLNEPLRAVGDTKDRFVQIDGKWYVERNVAKVTPNNDNIYKNDIYTGTNGSRFAVKVPDVKRTQNIKVVSNKLPQVITNSSWKQEGAYISTDELQQADNYYKIMVRLTTDLTIEQFISNYSDLEIIYPLASPTYEPVEIAPVLNTYSEVTHITNNSTIPMNMPIVNSGYELIAKPNTKYTVVGIDSGRIGDSTIVNGTITTPATITDNFLRPYGTGKTSKVMLLEGEPANIPGYFKGIKSVFDDKVTEDGKYVVEVKVIGKNKFDGKKYLTMDKNLYDANSRYITVNNDGSINRNTQTDYRSSSDMEKYKLIPNTTYTISTTPIINIQIHSKQGRLFDANSPITFTTPDDGEVGIKFIGGANSTAINNIFVQLEEGTVATEYEPYHETKQTLYLDEPLYNTNNITIYNDKLGYWKNWDKVVLDGSDGIDYIWNDYISTIKFRTNTVLNGLYIDNATLPKLICNKLITDNLTRWSGIDKPCVSIAPNNKVTLRLSISNSGVNINSIKQYLSQNPLTIVYQLAEPVFVPLIDNCPNWIIGSWDNCSIHFDSIIPLLSTRYRYTGNVPSVVTMSDDIDTVSSISDEQDALLIDMATELAVIKLTM